MCENLHNKGVCDDHDHHIAEKADRICEHEEPSLVVPVNKQLKYKTQIINTTK